MHASASEQDARTIATLRARIAELEGVWTDAERAAIADLSKRQELSEHAVLRQGLRLYQLQVLGPIERLSKIAIPKLAETSARNALGSAPPLFVPCDRCDTEGRIITMRGNDPDSERDHGPCPVCEGTGRMAVEAEPVTLEDLERVDCTQCGGSGCCVESACCGNTSGGACLGECAVPVQVKCEMCNGGGKL